MRKTTKQHTDDGVWTKQQQTDWCSAAVLVVNPGDFDFEFATNRMIFGLREDLFAALDELMPFLRECPVEQLPDLPSRVALTDHIPKIQCIRRV